MALTWVREDDPVWDADKRRVVGGAPEGAFVLPFSDGETLPGEWWAARDEGSSGTVVGYGRLDVTWGGDAEILLAVDPGSQGRGIGSFVLDHLEQEALDRGINYVHNTIRDHEQRDLVHDWLVVRGFRGTTDSDLRKRAGSTRKATPGAPATPSEENAETRPPADEKRGDEEQGGYVDVEDHRY